MHIEKDLIIYTEKPSHLEWSRSIAGCFIEYERKVLLLKRHPQKLQGEKWGLPAGGIEGGEDPISGALRELNEEASIIFSPREMKSLGCLFLERIDLHFCFHIFYKKVETPVAVNLKLDENTEYRWVPFEEAYRFPLITGGEYVLRYCVQMIEQGIK